MQGRNHGENLVATSVMVGRICPLTPASLVGIGLRYLKIYMRLLQWYLLPLWIHHCHAIWCYNTQFFLDLKTGGLAAFNFLCMDISMHETLKEEIPTTYDANGTFDKYLAKKQMLENTIDYSKIISPHCEILLLYNEVVVTV